MARKLALAAIILMVSASPVWAENWVKVPETVNGNEFFVDNDSIRKAGGFVYYWEMQNLLEPKTVVGVPTPILSNKIYIKLNCDSLGQSYLKIEAYDSHMGKGKLIMSFNPEPKWIYHPSGSVGDIINKRMCKIADN